MNTSDQALLWLFLHIDFSKINVRCQRHKDCFESMLDEFNRWVAEERIIGEISEGARNLALDESTKI